MAREDCPYCKDVECVIQATDTCFDGVTYFYHLCLNCKTKWITEIDEEYTEMSERLRFEE